MASMCVASAIRAYLCTPPRASVSPAPAPAVRAVRRPCAMCCSRASQTANCATHILHIVHILEKPKIAFSRRASMASSAPASAHAANFSMIPPAPKRHKGMEEEEVRRRSAPRPWPTGGWLMNYHVYSSAGSVSLQRGPGEPPCSTSHNHTSDSSAEPWTTLLSAPRAEGGVHDSVVTLEEEKDDICPWQWHPPLGTKTDGTKDQWRPGCDCPQPSWRQQHWPPDQASRARQAPMMYDVSRPSDN
jgi:hypothetical protein